jgi:DNA-binding NtrC family response regulator
MNKLLRVLLVEDSEPDALLLLRHLHRGGYEIASRRVDTASALNEALDGAEWDIVISDYQIPGFGGALALELFKSRGLDIPFIIVSGVIGEETAVGMMKAGAHDYLLKQNLARLVPAIERELREAEERRERRRVQAQREKLVTELQTALAEVKLLSGLLPICSSCKNIRDDEGYWHRVEIYIQKHSQAAFTHGICPDCMRRLYPQYAPKKDQKPAAA